MDSITELGGTIIYYTATGYHIYAIADNNIFRIVNMEKVCHILLYRYVIDIH